MQEFDPQNQVNKLLKYVQDLIKIINKQVTRRSFKHKNGFDTSYATTPQGIHSFAQTYANGDPIPIGKNDF